MSLSTTTKSSVGISCSLVLVRSVWRNSGKSCSRTPTGLLLGRVSGVFVVGRCPTGLRSAGHVVNPLRRGWAAKPSSLSLPGHRSNCLLSVVPLLRGFIALFLSFWCLPCAFSRHADNTRRGVRVNADWTRMSTRLRLLTLSLLRRATVLRHQPSTCATGK